ncbi:unnamed protein product [Lymnaea stagnalis]|uniref:Uncharacterized protein n=1 Tax=Lymnaea stagnalis TaxID=6523 RepID=A0AAV2HLD7_LYMST
MMYFTPSMRCLILSVTFSLCICLQHNSHVTHVDDTAGDYFLQSLLSRQPVQGYNLLTLLLRSRPPALRNVFEDYTDEDIDSEADSAPIEVLGAAKRSLGQCIHNCINSRGNMNFIQCKSMCH